MKLDVSGVVIAAALALGVGSSMASPEAGVPVIPTMTYVFDLPAPGRHAIWDERRGVAWVAVSGEGAVYAFDPDARALVGRIPVGDGVERLRLSLDGSHLYGVLVAGGRIAEVDLATFDVSWYPISSQIDGLGLYDVAEVAPGRLVVTSGNDFNDGHAIEIDRTHPEATADPTLQIPALDGIWHGENPALAVTPSGDRAFVVRRERELQEFDPSVIGAPLLKSTEPGPVLRGRTMAFSPDGEHLVLYSGNVFALNPVTHLGELTEAPWAFTADGAHLVTVKHEDAYVVDAATLESVDVVALPGLSGSEPLVTCLFTPDERHLMMLTFDGEFRGASLEAAQCLAPPTMPSRPIPGHGATGIDPSIPREVSWWIGDVSCAATYDVYAGPENPPTTLVATGLEVPWCELPPGESGQELYWSVVAMNAAGATAGPVWSYRTEPCPPPPYTIQERRRANGASIELYEAVVADPARDRVYLGDRIQQRIHVEDLQSGARVASWAFDFAPRGMALSPDGATLWVCRGADRLIHGLDPLTGEIVRTINLGIFTNPETVLVHPIDDRFLVVSVGSGGGFLVDTHEEQTTVAQPGAGGSAKAYGISAGGRYFVSAGSSRTRLIDRQEPHFPELGFFNSGLPNRATFTFSSDGRLFCPAKRWLWDLSHYPDIYPRSAVYPERVTSPSNVGQMAFMDQADRLWVVGDGSVLYGYDVATGRAVAGIDVPGELSGFDSRFAVIPGRDGHGTRGFIVAPFDGDHLLLMARDSWQDCDADGREDSCAIAHGIVADVNGDGVPDGCQVFGDVDGDGCLGFIDLVAMLSAWSAECPVPCPSDIDADGDVDFDDLMELLRLYTGCG